MGVGGRGGEVVARMLCLFSFLTAIYVVEKGHRKKRVSAWMNRHMDGVAGDEEIFSLSGLLQHLLR